MFRAGYAKVLLLIDPNSAVDALVQRTRARGSSKAELRRYCLFNYVLRKHEIRVGDTVVSSGLDGVFPKGLRVGQVSEVDQSECRHLSGGVRHADRRFRNA